MAFFTGSMKFPRENHFTSRLFATRWNVTFPTTVTFFDCASDPSTRLHKSAVNQLVVRGKTLSLAEFVSCGKLKNVMTNYLAAANHPDRRWQIIDGEALLELATDLLHKMDYVGIVNFMKFDLQFICRRVNVKPAKGIINPSSMNHEMIDDQRLIGCIRELNILDQEIFDRACKIRQDKLRRLGISP